MKLIIIAFIVIVLFQLITSFKGAIAFTFVKIFSRPATTAVSRAGSRAGQSVLSGWQPTDVWAV